MFSCRRLILVSLLCILLCGIVSLAQSSAVEVTAFRPAALYAGPGETYTQLGQLRAGVPVQVTERNAVGNWLHIAREDANIDGWVMTGYLNRNPDLLFSQIPVNDTLADADLSAVSYLSLQRLYAAPVIPEVSPAMRDVYARGLALGNHSSVITKVGDSLTADPLYLTPMYQGDHVLGSYDYLDETIDYFGASMRDLSVAARIGMTSYTVDDPMWRDPYLCEAGESPLECEYRRKQPSIALIMFGGNDVLHVTDSRFAGQMRLIVEESLERGIIPVLSTFSYHPDSRYWWQSVNLNLAVVEIGEEYDVPVINLWSAARSLPMYGLEADGTHMTHSGFYQLKFDTGHESWYGVSLRNLLSIRMLDELRRTLEMDVPAAPEATATAEATAAAEATESAEATSTAEATEGD